MSKELFESLDQAIETNEKLKSENNRLIMALQDIREITQATCITSVSELLQISLISGEALEGER